MLRLLVCCLALACAAAQTPEEYFRGAGAGFRGTPEEQQLFWQPHVAASHRRILQAAELAGQREIAVLLGPGVCSELPLAGLANRFERVILVDLDGQSMLEAVESLPPNLRAKVEIRLSDVTTFASNLMSDLEEATEASEFAEDAFDRFEAIFEKLETGVQKLWLPQADLVVSSLVLSELPRYPLAYADRLLSTQFKVRLRDWSGHPAARRKLSKLIVEDHVRILRSLRRDGGVIYYSDTIARGPAYSQFDAARRLWVEASVLAGLHELDLNGETTATILGPLCYGNRGVERETQAFERLLLAYEQSGSDTFEPLVPVEALSRRWKVEELSVIGEPESWWWLEYPCAIVHSPGAFRVTSWILK
jgi:hypothetical protein